MEEDLALPRAFRRGHLYRINDCSTGGAQISDCLVDQEQPVIIQTLIELARNADALSFEAVDIQERAIILGIAPLMIHSDRVPLIFAG